jgi:hypothetical protein
MTDTVRNVEKSGWALVSGVVPRELCARLVEVLRDEMGVPVDNPSGWPEYESWDIVPIWGHQAQWDIRQLPSLHRVWSELWGTEALFVSLDMARFTPPWREGSAAEPLPIHWDHDPHDSSSRMFQGVIALTDTERGQGGFRCVPALYHDSESWPAQPLTEDGRQVWNPDISGHEIVEVPARVGDLVVWDSLLPHANSQNVSDRPRLAFYVQMFPVEKHGEYEAGRRSRVELWRTGRCHPVWRWRPGCDRAEPWPPATLTPLGRRLLGFDAWPDVGVPSGGRVTLDGSAEQEKP